MPNRIMFSLQKGGVGKTTSTVAIAEILAAAGYHVLVVDFDPQGNATKMLTRDSIYKYSGRTIMEAVQTGQADPFIIQTKTGVDLIPAEDKLAAFSRYIYTAKIGNPYAVLQRLLQAIENRYDFVLVDVSPTLGDTVINALVYVDRVIIPLDIGDFSMDAMVRFMEFVDESRAEGHTNAVIDGILLTMRDGRSTRYERDISDGIREAYGDLVYRTEIHRRIRIKEMSAAGINTADPSMEDYIKLAEELLDRIKGKEEAQ